MQKVVKIVVRSSLKGILIYRVGAKQEGEWRGGVSTFICAHRPLGPLALLHVLESPWTHVYHGTELIVVCYLDREKNSKEMQSCGPAGTVTGL